MSYGFHFSGGSTRRLAVRCVSSAAFATGVSAFLLAETAQNAFVTVTADGVHVLNGRDFAATGTVAEVRANPGWRLLTPGKVRLGGGRPAVYRVRDFSGENDADGDIGEERDETLANTWRFSQSPPPRTAAAHTCSRPRRRACRTSWSRFPLPSPHRACTESP